MGVRGLMPLLARFAPQCIAMPGEQELRGLAVAVDSNIYVQRYFKGTDGGTDGARHLRGMRNMAKYMRSLRMTPLFVFDGHGRAQGKDAELARRRGERQRVMHCLDEERRRAQRIRRLKAIGAQLAADDSGLGAACSKRVSPEPPLAAAAAAAWLQRTLAELNAKPEPRQVTIGARMDRMEAGVCQLLLFRLGAAVSAEGSEKADVDALQRHSAERMATLTRRCEAVTSDQIGRCVDLIAALGFPTHVVEDEAESEVVCARLCRSGVVDAVCSEDLDVVACGARLLRGFFAGDAAPMALIDARRAWAELGLSRESFVDLCILCGTDFSSTLEKVGPITALRLISELGSIERILETGKYRARPGFNPAASRAVFLSDTGDLPITSRAQLCAGVGHENPAAVAALLPSAGGPGQGAADPFARGVVLP
ncbi:hypothetical protein GGF46_003133 [Coemansia sp. RSA 552]|nr:hypothetical protein GGF46_003133 [Coemansia sp. RSA 552]